MEVLALGAHAPDVEPQRRLHRVQAGFDVVGDRDVRHRRHLEPGLRVLEVVGVDVLAERRVVQRQPAVGDLGGHRHVLRALGAEEDRDLPTERMGDHLEGLAEPGGALAAVGVLVELALELERLLASEHLADDLDVLAGASERLAVRLAVPALHDLRAGHAETEDEAALAQVVDGDGVHRRRRRRATGELHHAGAQLDRRRVRGEVGEWAERVGAPRLGRPHRVEAEALRLLGQFDEVAGRQSAPVPPRESELHVSSPSISPVRGCVVTCPGSWECASP